MKPIVYDREKHLKAVEKFHLHRAKLPFDEKIRILIGMQEVAKGWKSDTKQSGYTELTQ